MAVLAVPPATGLLPVFVSCTYLYPQLHIIQSYLGVEFGGMSR